MEQKNFKKKILIISSNFYQEISQNLLEGALEVLKKNKFNYELVEIDGSLEIPFFLEKNKNRFLGFIVLGCIIKGETDHYEVVKKITYSQIYRTAYKNMLPLASALLTVENFSQALERSDKRKRNLGGQAARVCIQLIKKINE